MNDWFERVAIAANTYTEIKGVDENQIDAFIEYLFRVYGYDELLKLRKIQNT